MPGEPFVQQPTAEAAAPAPRRRRRPFGLSAIIVLLLFTCLAYSAALAVYAIDQYGPPAWKVEPTIEFGEAFITAIQLVWTVTVVIGLLARRLWAWYFMLILLSFSMVSDLVGFINRSLDFDSYINMLLNVCMVFYLNQRDVRGLFLARDAARRQPYE